MMQDAQQHDPDVRTYLAIQETLAINKEGLLVRRPLEGEFYFKDRVCIPNAYLTEAIQETHSATTLHHCPIAAGVILSVQYYAPRLCEEVLKVIRDCRECHPKEGRNPPGPMETLHISMFGPLKESPLGNNFLLVVRDSFSQWIEACPLKNNDAPDIVAALQSQILDRHGPVRTLSYTLSNALSEDVSRKVGEEMGCSTNWENFGQSIPNQDKDDFEACLTHCCKDGNQGWEESLPPVLWATRNIVSSSTGTTPYKALHGRNAVIPVPTIYGTLKIPRPPPTRGSERELRRAFQFLREECNRVPERSAGWKTNPPWESLPFSGTMMWLFIPCTQPQQPSMRCPPYVDRTVESRSLTNFDPF